jgi:hypothetical protein
VSEDRGQLPAGVASVLAVAEIPSSKLGRARRARLSELEREFYFWMLRRFATHGRPTSAEMRDAAARLDVDFETALATLAREDLVHLGLDGEIAVAYPFSGRPRGHRVRFVAGCEVEAMCAIDALGIAPMFGDPIEVTSHDPLTGEEIQVRLAPHGEASWEPTSAVVVTGVLERCEESFRGCCPALNFFASSANAERWLGEHPEVRGQVVSISDAIAAGRAVFGNIFDER